MKKKMMFILTYIWICSSIFFVDFIHGSTLTAPPLSVLVIGFENGYDLSLIANTLSDQGIDVTLVIPENIADDLHENLIDVEVYHLKDPHEKSIYPEDNALKFCESLFNDQELSQKVQEFRATITLFPPLRHDGCLLPWIKSIDSIPVILTRNAYEEVYAFERTGVALPILKGSFWRRIFMNFAWRSTSSNIQSNYVTPAFHIAKKYLTNLELSQDNLYSDVRLVLWGADSILRMDFASLTQMLVEIGCHHCRGSQPLPGELQKLLIQYRLGSIVVLLEEYYKSFIEEIAKKLSQGRQGQAVVWKIQESIFDEEKKLPENLYLWQNVDRQDLIGNGRTRLVLSHCTDMELLEIAFHGSPVICFPRDKQESKNAARAIELGFAHLIDDNNDRRSFTSEDITNFINTINTSMDYREKARRISVAIRDRLNPASDRLVYWLRYVARTKGDRERFLVASSNVNTLYEDFQFFLGLCTGIIVGVLLAGISFLFRYMLMSEKMRKSKGRYQR
ncbi:UDP-glucuronosyltransferase 2B14-like [Vespa crabro]|uniref:UDP-glucuronosyltransferase 2B14-like n=1 Tax=Vespa crabro TaxID=7445 RepID=UPI001EFF62F2|nr:UDP-glucuronosyltransferase 2B14-like [Vespa crabro]